MEPQQLQEDHKQAQDGKTRDFSSFSAHEVLLEQHRRWLRDSGVVEQACLQSQGKPSPLIMPSSCAPCDGAQSPGTQRLFVSTSIFKCLRLALIETRSPPRTREFPPAATLQQTSLQRSCLLLSGSSLPFGFSAETFNSAEWSGERDLARA